jgi:hypothetical protein
MPRTPSHSPPQYLDVPLGKYLDEAAQTSATARRRLWWLLVVLALIAAFLTSMATR